MEYVHLLWLKFGTYQMANLGDSVGILAVQSISEPGTQLT